MTPRIRELRDKKGIKQGELAKILGVSQGTLSGWENGKYEIANASLFALAEFFGVSVDYILGSDAPQRVREYQPPRVTPNVSIFRTIGTVAAGYGAEAFEDWTDEDAIAIPNEWLRGRPKEDFFALRVHGDSMYPLYLDGDRVLVLRQTTLNHPGDVGVVRYNGSEATLKRIDYVYGENWMRLRPENSAYPAITIRDAELENCQVLGIPWLVVREIRE